MQKQWSVEVVRCTSEWNAHETTWKSSCTSHWTIFHSFCHAARAQHVAGKYVWQFLHKQTHKQFMQNQKKPNMSSKKCRPILKLQVRSRYPAALLHGHTPKWTNQSVCRYLPCPQQSSQGQPICQTKIIGIHDMFFKLNPGTGGSSSFIPPIHGSTTANNTPIIAHTAACHPWLTFFWGAAKSKQQMGVLSDAQPRKIFPCPVAGWWLQINLLLGYSSVDNSANQKTILEYIEYVKTYFWGWLSCPEDSSFLFLDCSRMGVNNVGSWPVLSLMVSNDKQNIFIVIVIILLQLRDFLNIVYCRTADQVGGLSKHSFACSCWYVPHS